MAEKRQRGGGGCLRGPTDLDLDLVDVTLDARTGQDDVAGNRTSRLFELRV
jgi:hypothetical protein